MSNVINVIKILKFKIVRNLIINHIAFNVLLRFNYNKSSEILVRLKKKKKKNSKKEKILVIALITIWWSRFKNKLNNK